MPDPVPGTTVNSRQHRVGPHMSQDGQRRLLSGDPRYDHELTGSSRYGIWRKFSAEGPLCAKLMVRCSMVYSRSWKKVSEAEVDRRRGAQREKSLTQNGMLSSAITSAFQPAGERMRRKGMPLFPWGHFLEDTYQTCDYISFTRTQSVAMLAA